MPKTDILNPVWECLHVCLYVYTLHHHCEALGTIRALLEPLCTVNSSGPVLALLEPVADGPETGRIGWNGG
jgi:hypothetical protein